RAIPARRPPQPLAGCERKRTGAETPARRSGHYRNVRMQYHHVNDTVNKTVLPLPVRRIDAHSALHVKASKAVRACDSADILDGIAKLENLTLRLVAAGVGVSVGYLVQAHRLAPEQRQAVRSGKRPLVLPRIKPPAVPAPSMIIDGRRQLDALVDV